jgi:hypothetical protein
MAEKKEKPTSKWVKILVASIPAALAAYATIISTVIQTTGAKQEKLQQTDDNLQVLVKQINEEVLPKIQKLLDKHDGKIDKLGDLESALRERIAAIEGFLKAKRDLRYKPPVRKSAVSKPTAPLSLLEPDALFKIVEGEAKKAEKTIPLLRMQQTAK